MLFTNDNHPLLEIHNIYLAYEADNDIVHGLSLDLKPQEIVSIIGRNGSGKSTILKALFGLHPLRSGRVLFNDREITNIRPQNAFKTGIAFVPDYRNIFPLMTVYENLEVGLFGHGERLNFKERLDYILEYFPILADHLRHRAINLSGSEQRLLEIARALLWKPRLLLIDEPSLNLSSDMRLHVFETIERLNREIGLTVLMNEGHSHLGMSVCHRAYLLDSGKVIYEGTRSELLHNRTVIKTILGE